MERSCELKLFAKKGVHAYLVQCARSRRTGSPFQQMKTNTLEGSTNDGRSMFAMFLAVLHMVGLETETLK